MTYTLDDLQQAYALLDYRVNNGEKIEGLIAELDIDIDAVLHVSRQRALRGALLATGDDRLGGFREMTEPTPIKLTPEQENLMNTFSALELEGIVAALAMVRQKNGGGGDA